MVKRASENLTETRQQPVDSGMWNFEEKSRFIYAWLLTKINTEMHEKTLAITHNSGFELYRAIYNSVDAMPQNLEFMYRQQLMQLVPPYAGNTNNLGELFEFRTMLMKKVNEIKEAIGKELDHDMLKDILFSCMDMNPRQLISTAGLDNKKFMADGLTEVDMYKTFTEDSDRR